jgi:hypothetical protein
MGGIEMRLTALTFIGALGIGALSFAAVPTPASAAPLVPDLGVRQSSNIVQVWGGCGPGARPVPGHWSRWRGGWVPPHCAPNYHRPYAYRHYGPYGGWPRYGYGYGYHRYW